MKLLWDWPSTYTLSGDFYVEPARTPAYPARIRNRAPTGLEYDGAVLFIQWDNETPQEREEALQTLLLAAEVQWQERQAGVMV